MNGDEKTSRKEVGPMDMKRVLPSAQARAEELAKLLALLPKAEPDAMKLIENYIKNKDN